MKEKIMFVVDAAGDLPLDVAAANPITIVPAYVHIEDRPVTRDYVGISPQEYWEVLKTCKTPPHTSMAPPIEWMGAYKAAYEKGYTHVIVTTVSSTASGVFNAAVMAIDLLREEGIKDLVVEPVDFLGYSAMYGHALLRGCEMAAAGVPFAEILQKIKDISNKVEALVSVYTLKYLKLSGRINGVSAFAGEALGVRPILLAKGGSINPCDKVRGDKNIVQGLLTNLKNHINLDDPEQQVYVIYTDTPNNDGEELARLIKAELGIEVAAIWPLGSSITTNVGPLAVGVTYYGKPR